MRRRRKIQLALALLSLGVFLCVLVWTSFLDINSLTRAAQSGDVRSTRLQLVLGVDPNQPERYGYRRHASGYTPLTAASFAGHSDIVRILLRSGADVDLRSGSKRFPGMTPIATAASVGRFEVCQLLLESGADPNIPTGSPRGWTALDWALQADEHEVARLLREHGAVEGTRREDGSPETSTKD